ncbi:AMP-binding protein [Streptomyces sp. NPDC057638]|uniref:AMP-binding protein n=1 Tax=Streptomyces sp. NPDC057638 TaxID=3346190 RepID=UPI0036B7063C
MSAERPSVWGGSIDPLCFLDALTTTATERPEAVAVEDGDRSLTYAALLEWAGSVADLLGRQGVRPGEPVAVTGPRGAEVIAALLGIAMAGATYVPLDPEYPAKRLEHMVTDSAARLLLYCGGEPGFDADVPRLRVPEPGGSGDPAPGGSGDPAGDRSGGDPAPRPLPCRPELPVYIIYTSGSTGWPKGVTVTHSCLDAMAEWQAAHSPRPDLRTAQFAPLNFDVSFQEILGTLRGGGTVVVVPERLRRTPDELLQWLVDHRVERLFLPYVAMQMLAVVAAARDGLDGLRLTEVNVAGEQMVCTTQIRRFFERLPGCRLVNHYGQSESAMVTSHILTGPPADWPDLPPIGVPLPGCEVLVDPESPDDPAVGELLVAGRPVSPGYLHRPELTERRFRPTDPTPRGHTRVFHTGDLVRLVDGEVWFLNRIDDDVKIRGIRVNLLEVDAQLLAQPGIDAAATVVVESASGVRGLRAAVVTAPGTGLPDTAAVLAALRETLPAVSVPLSLTGVSALPRTPSGKTDRDAVAALITQELRERRTTRTAVPVEGRTSG